MKSFLLRYVMKFPQRTPKILVDCITENQFLAFDEEIIEKFFQVKAWKMYINGNIVGLQISFTFHTSDGVGIEQFPVFPDKGTDEYNQTKKKLVSFGGFLNIRSEDLSEDQFNLLSTLNREDSKPIQLYGAMVIKFKPKVYTKDGVEKEIVEIKAFPDLDTFQVGKAQTYESLKGKAGNLPASLFRYSAV